MTDRGTRKRSDPPPNEAGKSLKNLYQMKPLILPLIATAALSLPLFANENPEKPANPSKQKVTSEDRSGGAKQSRETLARLGAWFTDAKFGVFIHFGVYSALEGEYKGRGADHHYSEWIQHAAEIPAKEYHEIAAGFNPVGFNADDWVSTFKNCGARYVVITAKHHDGFALYDSAVSKFNIVDHTPFKRDIVKELEEATHRQGLKFGVYYSHAQDWDEPDAPFLNKKNKTKQLHPELPADFKPDMDRYITKKSLP
jgi:alpha-L-fucosidase